MNSKISSISFVSITKTPRFNNKAVDLPVAALRESKIITNPHYFHGKFNVDQMFSSILTKNSEVVAVNITVHNYKESLDLCERLKVANKITIGFGEFATQFYSDIFSLSNAVDIMLLGDPELPLISLINNGMEISRESAFFCHVATRNEQSLKEPYWNKSFVFPVFDYFEQFNRRQNTRKEYLLQTKNAVCNGKCVFCRSRKGHMLYRDIKDVFLEIEHAHKLYGIKKFFFTDEDIFDGPESFSKSRIRELCELIINSRYILALKCYMKASTLSSSNQQDIELLKKMSQAGVVVVFVGIESGSSDDLILYQKGTTVDQNNETIRLLRSQGIFVQIGFLSFNPFSKRNTLSENFFFLKKNSIDNLFMWIGYVRVFKHTKIYELAKNSGLLNESIYSYIDYSSLYSIKDPEVNKIFDFVINKMYPRVYSLDYDFDWLYSFYLDVMRITPNASIHSVRLNQIKSDQLERISIFFEKLYVEFNLEYCNNQVDSFLSRFEEDQIELSKIYMSLVEMYIA